MPRNQRMEETPVDVARKRKEIEEEPGWDSEMLYFIPNFLISRDLQYCDPRDKTLDLLKEALHPLSKEEMVSKNKTSQHSLTTLSAKSEQEKVRDKFYTMDCNKVNKALSQTKSENYPIPKNILTSPL